MKKILILLTISFLFMAQSVFANVCDNISQYKLSNGQTLIVKQVKDNPIVVINTFIKTGSVNENDQNNGVAHFLEHLFFKGTTNHKRGEFETILEKKGGVFNAATSKDYTHYYVLIGSKYFEDALKLHSDMLLNVAIPQNELDMERKVVLEEISRSNDNPDNKLFQNFINILFAGNPYQRKILGTEKNIQNISRDEIFSFYNTWYKPDNMVTIVVGDIEPEKVKNNVEKYFKKDYKNNIQKAVPSNPKIPLNLKQNPIVKDDVKTGYFLAGFKTGGNINIKEGYALQMAANILANNKSSVLYKKLKKDENIVTDIGAGTYDLKTIGMFYVAAEFEPKNYEKTKKIITEELENFKNYNIPVERLNLIKNAIKRDYIYSNERVADISNLIGQSIIDTGKTCSYCNYIEDIDSITPEFIKATYNKYYSKSNVVTSTLLPEKHNTKTSLKKQQNNSQIQTNNAKFISQYKNIKKFKFNNGAVLITEKRPINDVVALKIFIKGGELAEKKAGTASLVTAGLLSGTKTKTNEQIEDELYNIGANISAKTAPEYIEVTLETTKNDFHNASLILKDVLQNSIYDEKLLKKDVQDMLNQIKSSSDKPFNVASENFNEEFFKNSAFLKTNKILEKTLPTITRNDVLDFYNHNFIPENMVISVAGNINENDVIKEFSTLKNTEHYPAVKDEVIKQKIPDFTENRIRREAKKSQSAWVILGWQTKGLSTNDFATLKLIDTILGTGFSSRLFVNLREKQGLAYEVGSSSQSRFNTGIFQMYIGTNPKNLAHVEKEFLREINDFKTKKVSQEELQAAKDKLLGRIILSRESNMSRAFSNGYYEFFDKGYRFSYDYPELLKKVTTQDIYEVANRYFSKPYIMSIVADGKYLKEE